MRSAQTATLAASMGDIVAAPGQTVPLQEVLRQRQLFAEMVEAMQGDVTLQQVLDSAVRTAAQGCGAPMGKVLELDAARGTLVIRSHHGLKAADMGREVGEAASGNPPGEALRQAAPVVDADVRRRPRDVLPAIFVENAVVTSVNLPLINHDGAYGVLEVDFRETVEIGALEMSFLASVAGMLAECIEKHRAQAALALERDAKALLLREQQHRVRNNFQMIIAMVQRSTFLASEDGRKPLREIERRIFAMASLYNHLLGLSEQAQHADLGRYLGGLAASFDEFYDLKASGIAFNLDVQFGLVADLDRCTTIGIIVNELVANAVEHAFAGGSGEIRVSLAASPPRGCVVRVSDDGRGLPAGPGEEGVGLRTVRRMLEGIGGRLDVASATGQGAAWTITVDRL
ncbi:sensor histidine kinase [Cupriavidus pauculus]|nr:ATP-binding protein [Cupriavidus pauculus]